MRQSFTLVQVLSHAATVRADDPCERFRICHDACLHGLFTSQTLLPYTSCHGPSQADIQDYGLVCDEAQRAMFSTQCVLHHALVTCLGTSSICVYETESSYEAQHASTGSLDEPGWLQASDHLHGVATTAEQCEDQQLMIVQIPLIVRNAETRQKQIYMQIEDEIGALPQSCLDSPEEKSLLSAPRKSCRPRGMRDAAIKPSRKSQGPFDGLKNAKLERDPHGPIRVTMQLYKVMLMQQALQMISSLTSLLTDLTASTAEEYQHETAALCR